MRTASALDGESAAWLDARLDYGAPIALGGCRCRTESFECCEYNVTVFDGRGQTEEILDDGRTVVIRHDSLMSPSSGTFAHLAGMQVVSDPQWELGPRIADMLAKKESVFAHATKSALVDAQMMVSRARTCLEGRPAVAPFWLKCAAYRVADSISYHNMEEPSPAHMMARFRAMPKSAPNEELATVSECLGLERATPSLVARMARSAAGFARMAGIGDLATDAMEAKADHLASMSLLTDCHYYIGYAACAALRARREYAHEISDGALHALRVALDPEGNAQNLERQLVMLDNSISKLMSCAGWSALTVAGLAGAQDSHND